MSFRELRNCAEMLRSLGFLRQISMENFRNPNFTLVSEILIWLVERFDPNARIPTDIDTQQDRIIFIRSVAQFMASKANVKMNTKKLYQADGFAVQEILKALSLLYAALHSHVVENEDSEGTPVNYDISNKLQDMKQIRALASSITGKGATLFDLLRREVDLRDIRNNVVNRQLELVEVEGAIQSAIKATEKENSELQSSIDNVGTDEANLDSKIEKKTTALDRSQKRLATLRKVRPAFMDEYEKLEADLKKHYESFTERFINLSFLEQQLDDQERLDVERIAEREIAKKLMEKPRGAGASLGTILKDDDSDEDDEDDDDDDDDLDDDLDDDDDLNLNDMGGIGKNKNPPKRSPRNPERRVFGSMTGLPNDDSESLDSEGELALEDNQLDMQNGNQRPAGIQPKGTRTSNVMAPSFDSAADDF